MMTIGLRIPGACSKEPLADFAAWCKNTGFDALDLNGRDLAARAQTVRDAGLAVGTVDVGLGKLLSSDEGVRKEAVENAVAAVNTLADAGANKAFCVFAPENAQQSRRESLENWKQSFPTVAAEAEKRSVRFALEGWPGSNNSALGVVPETLRAMFEAVPSEAFGLNYDPSHLVRVGVDYLRFLNEFAHRVIHVHGKDTALDEEGLYLHGNLGPSLTRTVAFGGGDWRYCIPGEGEVKWDKVCARLHQAGYEGVISLELEDFRYNGSLEGEKRGLVRAREHLLPYL